MITNNQTRSLAIFLCNRLHISKNSPNAPSSINIFSPYDGNIVGGLLLGCGLALTGACPGTVLPQVATSVPSAPLVAFGSILGGILYSRFGKGLKVKVEDRELLEKPAVYQRLGVSQGGAVVAYIALCAAVVAIASSLVPGDRQVLVAPVVGGLLIGGSQAANLILTGNTLGVSAAYEQIGDLFWWAQKSLFGKAGPRPTIRSTAFALGTVLGSFTLSRAVEIPAAEQLQIGKLRSVIGGVVMLFGARIAGGCTSGHGISGMSQLSIASIVSVAAMFGGGMALTALLG
jgi:uncharacterized membrane protein YedE/YeeE